MSYLPSTFTPKPFLYTTQPKGIYYNNSKLPFLTVDFTLPNPHHYLHTHPYTRTNTHTHSHTQTHRIPPMISSTSVPIVFKLLV